MQHLAAALLFNPNAQAHVREQGNRGCRDAGAMNSDFYLQAGRDSTEMQGKRKARLRHAPSVCRQHVPGLDGAGAPWGGFVQRGLQLRSRSCGN